MPQRLCNSRDPGSRIAAPREHAGDRIEKPLGVITASKVSDADSKSQKTGLFFLDLLCAMGGGGGCGASSTARDDQHITLTMVVLPSLARDGEYSVRITIQRVIYDKMDRILVLERIDDATYEPVTTIIGTARPPVTCRLCDDNPD